ncbi:MAG: class I SAM-dependent methyltransferase [Proteobacteria bacterium]|nr:class I SAM-dependent methyltransferase [Pseudomonadota bacterium]
MRQFTLSQVQRFTELAGLPSFQEYVLELEQDTQLVRDVEAMVADVDHFRTKHWDSVHELGLYRIFLYCLTRSRRPGLFVETGVLHGLTSLFILEALERNGQGRLVSIDAPSYFETGPANLDGVDDRLPPRKEPGWVIGPHRRQRFDLRIGLSSEHLEPALCEGPPAEIFLHDSDHTPQNMKFELETALRFLAPGGIIVCDNCINNTAFFDFCSAFQLPMFVFPAGGPGGTAKRERERNLVRFGVTWKPVGGEF